MKYSELHFKKTMRAVTSLFGIQKLDQKVLSQIFFKDAVSRNPTFRKQTFFNNLTQNYENFKLKKKVNFCRLFLMEMDQKWWSNYYNLTL